ncbi:MAG TPA: response regulator [Ramlibacter sp.]|nr:response regulator [Ramlibacter sp.]
MTTDTDAPETMPTPLPQPASPKVLLVEDDAINQTVAQRLLERLGATVAIAANGQLAVEMATRERYDLVFMDVQMPVMDGLAATRVLREAGLLKLPIVAMTASANAEQKRECAAAGMNDMAPKPIDVRHLADALACWTPQPPQRLPAVPSYDLSGLPLDVPGLDVSGALARMLGRKPLYLEMLARYVETQRELPSQVRAALAQDDHHTAFRLAHTAKGLAGTVGATEVQAMAQALEKSLKPPAAPADHIDAALGALETALNALFEALPARLMPAPAVAQASEPESPDA